ncbi:IS5/IS1182 family transposase, partial [Halomonas maura]|nr:IS5/IS1182 family transposase [Halomonas maura]
RKVRYKGLVKNQTQLLTLFALGNLVMAGRCQGDAEGASAS